MRVLTRWQRPAVVFAHDVLMASLCLPITLVLTAGTEGTVWPAPLGASLLPTVIVYVIIMSIAFSAFDMYRGVWRYASLRDLRAILLAVVSGAALFALIQAVAGLPVAMGWRSLVIAVMVQTAALAGPRYLYRYARSRSKRHLLRGLGIDAQRVVVLGYGNRAEAFVREANADLSLGLEVVAVVDLAARWGGARIHGVPVIAVPAASTAEALFDLVGRQVGRFDALVIADDPATATWERVSELFREARRRTVQVKKLAPARTTVAGEDRVGEGDRLTRLDYEDLLRRPGIKLAKVEAGRLITGRRILITGSGGTIGSELARQIADLGPAALGLVDHGEYALYKIDRRIRGAAPDFEVTTVLADVTDEAAVDRLFADFAPDVVFHAAALKHVPLVEANPVQGVHTNLLGTRVVAEACRRHQVSVMINISTDKAVAPSSVMGASKRAAEALVRAMDLHDGAAGSRYLSVRFGNVLGSTGSVVPLFRAQILSGGPVTVTDPEMTRYLMTTDEAVSLMLTGSGLCPAGDLPLGTVLVLDMGEPRRILDIAYDMIGLAGLVPDVDVPIRFIGRRPGEKLHEALTDDDETLRSLDTPLVRAIVAPPPNPVRLDRLLDQVAQAVRQKDRSACLQLLPHLVPSYRPDRSAAPAETTAAVDRQAAAGPAE